MRMSAEGDAQFWRRTAGPPEPADPETYDPSKRSPNPYLPGRLA
jgi:hypothetical protein